MKCQFLNTKWNNIRANTLSWMHASFRATTRVFLEVAWMYLEILCFLLQTTFHLFLRTSSTWAESPAFNQNLQNARRTLLKRHLQKKHVLRPLNDAFIQLRVLALILFHFVFKNWHFMLLFDCLFQKLTCVSFAFAFVKFWRLWAIIPPNLFSINSAKNWWTTFFHDYVHYVHNINIFPSNFGLFWSNKKNWNLGKFWIFEIYVPDVCMINFFVILWHNFTFSKKIIFKIIWPSHIHVIASVMNFARKKKS